MGKTRMPARLAKLLHNWNVLNVNLMGLNERDVARLLAHEEANGKRLTFLLRLQSRLNKLRRARERVRLVHKSSAVTTLLPKGRYK